MWFSLDCRHSGVVRADYNFAWEVWCLLQTLGFHLRSFFRGGEVDLEEFLPTFVGRRERERRKRGLCLIKGSGRSVSLSTSWAETDNGQPLKTRGYSTSEFRNISRVSTAT